MNDGKKNVMFSIRDKYRKRSRKRMERKIEGEKNDKKCEV